MNEPASPLKQKDVRVQNAWRVLSTVRTLGATSRPRVSAETGLTMTTIHRLVADLARRGLLVSDKAVDRAGAGRPAPVFRFNATIGYVAGIDVGNETTRGAIADLDGTIVARESGPTREIATDLSGGLEALVRRLQRQARQGHALPVIAVAVGVPGVTDAAAGRIVRASMHRPWDGLPLGSLLKRGLGVDVAVAQDDHFAALAELRRGACIGLRHALVLNIGKGIGAGLIVDGEPYVGAHSAAGRMGWIDVPLDPAPQHAVSHQVAPERDGIGRTPPEPSDGFERAALLLTADGLIADYRRLGGLSETPGAIDVFDLDRDGDVAATAAIDLFADRLGWLLGAVVSVLDPQRVVIGGGIGGSYGRLAQRVCARLDEVLATPPAVVRSDLGQDAGIVGSITAALELANDWLRARIEP